MRYWITTQWPSPHKLPRPHRNIFLPDGREEPGLRVRLGDRVAIYEAKGGRSEIVFEEGKKRILKAAHNGRQGIVTLGEVVSPMMSSGRGPSTYTNDSEIWWRYKIETAKHNDSGYISRPNVCKVLGFKDTYNFRGFGEKSSGLKEISEDEFLQLAEMFTAKTPKKREFAPPKTMSSKFGSGGEGPVHKALKEYVAANPEKALGEQGLEHVGTEVIMPSGDKIDILLRDQLGRYVAVEIEEAQGPGQLDGLCQAVKYRFLACVAYEADFEASRSALVAFDLDKSLEPIAKRYEVELILVDRGLVEIPRGK